MEARLTVFPRIYIYRLLGRRFCPLDSCPAGQEIDHPL